MKFNRLLIVSIVGTQFAAGAFAADEAAPGNDTDIDALKQEIQDLDQKVRILERQHELEKSEAADAAKKQPIVKLGPDGFAFSSADKNFNLALHGLVQLDSRSFFDDTGGTAGKNSFLLRRARPIITGTLFRDFDFNFTPDFGGSSTVIYDAYLNYRFRPELQLEAGKFKSPVGLEVLQSINWISFNERSIATDLAPNRDIGVELHGDLFDGVASYAAGILDGTPDYSSPTANQDSDDNKAFAGRVFLQPWKTSNLEALQGLGFGVGGSYESDRNGSSGLTGGYATDGQQKFFTYASGVVANGEHWRISPQAYYYYGPFSLLGEYIISDQNVSRTTGTLASADLQNSAWEVSVGWVLTGEPITYKGLTPQSPFDPRKGHWGAWQIVARYADVDLDDSAFSPGASFAAAGSASEAKAWSIGLNWYLNKNLRVETSFSRTTFTDGISGSSSAVTRQPENVLFTRLQLAF